MITCIGGKRLSLAPLLSALLTLGPSLDERDHDHGHHRENLDYWRFLFYGVEIQPMPTPLNAFHIFLLIDPKIIFQLNYERPVAWPIPGGVWRDEGRRDPSWILFKCVLFIVYCLLFIVFGYCLLLRGGGTPTEPFLNVFVYCLSFIVEGRWDPSWILFKKKSTAVLVSILMFSPRLSLLLKHWWEISCPPSLSCRQRKSIWVRFPLFVDNNKNLSTIQNTPSSYQTIFSVQLQKIVLIRHDKAQWPTEPQVVRRLCFGENFCLEIGTLSVPKLASLLG